MTRNARVAIVSLALLTIAACAALAQDAAPVWSAEEVCVVEGFRVPECALFHQGELYVSNIDSDANGYWADDGAGYVSAVRYDGTVAQERWVDGLDAPKGMAFLGETLFVADNTRVLMIRDGKLLAAISPPGVQHLNDMASDGEFAYVTDTLGSALYRVAPNGETTPMKCPPSPNGVTCHEGRMFVVSWDLHDVFEVDPEGVEEPRAFGLGDHFTNLDGIEVLGDGTILVSDFYGNKVCAIGPDEKTVTTLAEVECPADIGVDPDTNRLFIPQFLIGKLAIYDLTLAEE